MRHRLETHRMFRNACASGHTSTSASASCSNILRRTADEVQDLLKTAVVVELCRANGDRVSCRIAEEAVGRMPG